MPMARSRRLTAAQYEVSRSRMRSRGASSHGNASVIWRAIHSAVGFAVTLVQTKSSPLQTQDDQPVEQFEPDRRNDEQIDAGDVGGVITQESLPARRARAVTR